LASEKGYIVNEPFKRFLLQPCEEFSSSIGGEIFREIFMKFFQFNKQSCETPSPKESPFPSGQTVIKTVTISKNFMQGVFSALSFFIHKGRVGKVFAPKRFFSRYSERD